MHVISTKCFIGIYLPCANYDRENALVSTRIPPRGSGHDWERMTSMNVIMKQGSGSSTITIDCADWSQGIVEDRKPSLRGRTGKWKFWVTWLAGSLVCTVLSWKKRSLYIFEIFKNKSLILWLHYVYILYSLWWLENLGIRMPVLFKFLEPLRINPSTTSVN